MAESDRVYEARCNCGSVQLRFTGSAVAAGYCHCVECRTARQSDAFDFIAWQPDQQMVTKGDDKVVTYAQTANMTMSFCSECGSGLHHTNVIGVHSLSRSLFRNANGGNVPQGLEPQLHIFYGERVMNADDSLPKFKDLPEPFGGNGELVA